MLSSILLCSSCGLFEKNQDDDQGGDSNASSWQFNFACNADRESTNENPVFVPPFALSALYGTANTGAETGCDYSTSSTCNPGGAIDPVGGLFMSPSEAGHVRPTPHMYVSLKSGESSNIYAMGNSYLVSLSRTKGMNEYSALFSVSCSLYFYHAHIDEISHPKLIALATKHIGANYDDTGAEWAINLGYQSDSADGSTKNVTDNVEFTAGEVLFLKSGTKSGNIDVGVVDLRVKNGTMIDDNQVLWGANNNGVTTSGNRHIHAVSFTNYLSDKNRHDYLRFFNAPTAKKPPAIDAKSVNTGSAVTNIEGKLQGTYFNPSIFTVSTNGENVSYADYSAFTIFKTIQDPAKARLVFGLATSALSNSDSADDKLAAVDPLTWNSCSCSTQGSACDTECYNKQERPSYYADHFKDNYIKMSLDSSSTTVNPDPANVKPGTTVCYDFQQVNRSTWDRIYVQMANDNAIKIKLFPTHSTTAQCSTAAFPSMSENAIYYVRKQGA